MPLKLAKDHRFSWPVKVMRPDGEEWKTFEFTAHFLAFTSQDLDQLGAGAIDGAQALSEHLVGWEGIQDAGGQPLAFSPETMALALNDIDVRRGLMEAQVETASGGAERKNSKPLPVH